MLKGIDISQWQSRRFPLEEMAKVNAFCYIRAYGRGKSRVGIDPLFYHYQKEAQKTDMLLGTYSALYPDIPIKEQVITTYQAMVRGHAFGNELPLALDVELPKIKMPMVHEWCMRMLDIFETPLVIYTGVYYWKRLARNENLQWILDYDIKLWIAHWQVSRPTVPPPWEDWYVWQTDSDGKVGGIRFDRNLARSLP